MTILPPPITPALSGKRSSNIELLRLLCMLFILFHHFIVAGLAIIGNRHGDIVTPAGLICNSFFIIGVNCFILISGYFGIKPSWKGFFHLYLVCIFYLVVIYLISLLGTDSFSIATFAYCFMPFSHHYELWFIPNYAFLYLLSPLLNRVIDRLDKRQYVVILSLWCFLTFYFGYIWNKTVNVNGYNEMNFMFLYFIGGFIARHVSNVQTGKRRLVYLGGYLFCSLLTAAIGLVILQSGVHLKWLKFLCFPYNSPFIVAAAVAVFLFFRSLSIQSKYINWAASSALAIYLIHNNSHVFSHLKDYVAKLGQTVDNSFLLAAYLFLLAVGIMIACILIDKVRILITNPVEKLFNRFDWNGYAAGFITRIEKCIK